MRYFSFVLKDFASLVNDEVLTRRKLSRASRHLDPGIVPLDAGGTVSAGSVTVPTEKQLVVTLTISLLLSTVLFNQAAVARLLLSF